MARANGHIVEPDTFCPAHCPDSCSNARGSGSYASTSAPVRDIRAAVNRQVALPQQSANTKDQPFGLRMQTISAQLAALLFRKPFRIEVPMN
ncbi:hypothetical protein [Ruegeria sediminis]|uniref:hypothetical protein n=1 Tax=Ruegeria sediminis TaxID=2583820 RepID=UPI00319E49A0